MKFLTSSLLAAALTVSAAHAAWPTKPVHLVLPYPPGGNVDGATRVISEELQLRLKQPFVIDNRPGAGGMIAATAVTKAPADGYTLFVGVNGPILFSPLVYKRPLYQWKREFEPIGLVSITPLVLQVSAESPYRTIGELLEATKRPDANIAMATPGAGGPATFLASTCSGTPGPSGQRCISRATRRPSRI